MQESVRVHPVPHVLHLKKHVVVSAGGLEASPDARQFVGDSLVVQPMPDWRMGRHEAPSVFAFKCIHVAFPAGHVVIGCHVHNRLPSRCFFLIGVPDDAARSGHASFIHDNLRGPVSVQIKIEQIDVPRQCKRLAVPVWFIEILAFDPSEPVGECGFLRIGQRCGLRRTVSDKGQNGENGKSLNAFGHVLVSHSQIGSSPSNSRRTFSA